MPQTCRIKLEIIPSPEDSTAIKFILWDLKKTGKSLFATGIKTGVLQKLDNKKNTLENLADSWVNGIFKAEEDFKKDREKIVEKHRELWRNKSIKEEEIDDKLYQSKEWTEDINALEKTFMIRIGNLIHTFSLEFQSELLPDYFTEKDFWEKFNQYIDKPSISNDRAPLVQIQTTQELSIIPWWLCRTQDEKTLWCCRYAIGFAPFTNEIRPPDITFKNIRILSITRPTEDTCYRLPITAETFESAEALYESGELKWEMLDGIYYKISDPKKNNLNDDSDEVRTSFRGICKNDIRTAKKKMNPNIWFYQGHWKNQAEKDMGPPPYLILHDEKISNHNPRPRALPASLLRNIAPPSEHADSVLIMNACASGSISRDLDFISKYLSSNSLFFGSNYPILADMPDSSASLLLQDIVKKGKDIHLSHILLDAQQLSCDLNSRQVDYEELYKKAALCLFGDVTTHLNLTYDITIGDNVKSLILKITQEWQKIFEKDFKITSETFGCGFTFNGVDEERLAATADYYLSNNRPELAICPLATAIHLCVSDPDEYIILGPALSSESYVELASVKAKGYSDFKNAIVECSKKNKKFLIGLRKKTLTTSYMIQLIIRNLLKTGLDSVAEKVIPPFVEYQYEFNNYDFINDKKNQNEVDTFLVLFEDIEKIHNNPDIVVLLKDIESEVANILNIDFLPRGVFVGRKASFRNESWQIIIDEFFQKYNETLSKINRAQSAEGYVEVKKCKGFLTYKDANTNPQFLRAIKKFSDEAMFPDPINSLKWDSFYVKPTIDESRINEILKPIEEFSKDIFPKEFIKNNIMDDSENFQFQNEIKNFINRLRNQLLQELEHLQFFFLRELHDKIINIIDHDNSFLKKKESLKKEAVDKIKTYLNNKLICKQTEFEEVKK